MPLYQDVAQPQTGFANDGERTNFQIAHLNRRVEVLEDLVIALLEGRVHGKVLDNYLNELRYPHLPVNTANLQHTAGQVIKDLKNSQTS